jgi:uncharacterized protein (TIGR00369 family)
MTNAEQPSDPSAAPPDGAALARGWLESSPFVALLGIRLEQMEPDRALLSMPFGASLPTLGEVVHGGAISSLIDTAAATAAWSGAEMPERPRASTVGLTVDFLAPARGQGITADARVARRGGTGLCVCQVSVAADDGAQVALALVTYQL